MIIRKADLHADAPSIVVGAKDFISRMNYTDFLPETEEGLTSAIGRLLSIPGIEVTLAEYEGHIVVGLGIFYGPHIWNPDVISAEELFWWTAEDAPKHTALRLFRSVIKDVRGRGALATFKKLTSSPQRLESIYLRVGLKPVETSFMGVI